MKDKTLSILLPVHNASATLIPVVQECLHTIPRFVDDYEIIIVDNKSQDTTPTIADNLAANYAPIMVLHQPRRQGFGRALYSAIQATRGDYLLIMDTCGSSLIGDIARLFKHIEDYELVRGYRLQPPYPWHQRITSSSITRLVQQCCNVTLHDVHCHVILLHASLLQEIHPVAHSPCFTLELYLRAHTTGRPIVQVGIPTSNQQDRTTSTPWSQLGLRSLWELFRLRNELAISASQAVTTSPRPSFSFWARRAILGAGVFVALRGVWRILRRQTAQV